MDENVCCVCNLLSIKQQKFSGFSADYAHDYSTVQRLSRAKMSESDDSASSQPTKRPTKAVNPSPSSLLQRPEMLKLYCRVIRHHCAQTEVAEYGDDPKEALNDMFDRFKRIC